MTSLDEEKHRAQVAMRTDADASISRAKALVDRAFTKSQAALMAATSQAEARLIENRFVAAMTNLLGAIDAFDR